METFRLIILGAGFSKPAGLPLAADLFHEVRTRVRQLHGSDNPLERDLKHYLNYVRDTEGFNGSANDVDVEKFLSYLDVEHYLQMAGSDTWSDEGNLTQLLVRHTIGYVLLDRTPEKLPELYSIFASRLDPSDWILTFNYDTLLEQSLESIGMSFRLFPHRFSEIHTGSATVDYSKEEVVILKLHGSIDWFDRGRYNEKVKQATDYPQPYHVKHPLFAPDTLIESQPIVDGPRFTDDPLLQIYRVKNPGMVYAGSSQYWECSPFLLNPSHSKLLYVKPLIEFWRGWGRAGGLQLGLGIIGYSLPDYDDYARQLIYKLSKNYQEYEPNFELNGRVKRPVRVLDFRAAESDQAGLRARYQFMNPKRTQYWYDGLSEKGIEWFMA